MLQFAAYLTVVIYASAGDVPLARSVIYYCNMFMVQARVEIIPYDRKLLL